MRRTIEASDNPAVLGGVRAKNNGRHWATPPEIFDPLHARFNFTLDPCATPETAKCSTYFTEEDNGLEQSWAGHKVFMNPPYGREVYAWTKKAREEAARGTAFVVGLLLVRVGAFVDCIEERQHETLARRAGCAGSPGTGCSFRSMLRWPRR